MPVTGAHWRASFDGRPESAGAARSFVAGALAEAGRGDLSEVAVLLVSELVSNSVLHAGTAIEVDVDVGRDTLTVEVHDHHPGLAMRRHYSPTSATGRGLMLVEELARDWGTVSTEGGKYVWFSLDTRPHGSGTGAARRTTTG